MGGKYCWEKEVVLILKPKNSKYKIQINGNYDGYGRMYISDNYKNLKNGFYWEDFDLYPYSYEAYNTRTEKLYNQLCIDIACEDQTPLTKDRVYIHCRSCYLKYH